MILNTQFENQNNKSHVLLQHTLLLIKTFQHYKEQLTAVKAARGGLV